ncbi:MAG: ATP-grasp domain-containing protein [Patescibacteria group bacterium]|nr:ATP-grasp domain-containing protein [Patescibacteria group bacterium]
MARIVVITTSPEMGEQGRIAQEAQALGYDFCLLSLKDFNYSIVNGEIKVEGYEPRKGDIIITRAIFKLLHAITALVSYYKTKGVKVFDNNLLNHKYSINKLTDFIKLATYNIPMPKTYHVSYFSMYEEVVNNVGYPAIIKLTKTGRGKGIYKVASKEELDLFIKERESLIDSLGLDPNEKEFKLKKEAERFVIQEFIPYIHDLRILVIGEKVYCMKRIPKEGDFRANFSLGGSVELFAPDQKDIDLARKALDAVGLTIGGVDILITQDGRRYVLEANHTPGMLGMEEATGENITKEYLQYAIANAR